MSKTTKYREFDRVERLKRRAEWLQSRIERHKAGYPDWDRGELSALEWAIPVLEAYLIKKHTANLSLATLEAIKHELPEHLYKQLLEGRAQADDPVSDLVVKSLDSDTKRANPPIIPTTKRR